MKLDPKVTQLAAELAPQVAWELSQAALLSKKGLYTEAGMRLGRAVESCLYFTARELALDLEDRIIEEFGNLRDQLRQREVEILRGQSNKEVEDLVDVASKVARLIYTLAAEASSRQGQPSTNPKRTEALLKEMLQAVGKNDKDKAAKLGKHLSVLRGIQTRRNQAAHASISGEARELGVGELTDMGRDVDRLIHDLLFVCLGARSSALSVAS